MTDPRPPRTSRHERRWTVLAADELGADLWGRTDRCRCGKDVPAGDSDCGGHPDHAHRAALVAGVAELQERAAS